MTDPKPTFASFQTIEDQHRDAKERAAILIKYFDAAADLANSEHDNIGMFAAFGFEHLTREIVRAIDTMLLEARTLARALDEKGGQQ